MKKIIVRALQLILQGEKFFLPEDVPCNIGIDESDKKVERLFELVKKLNKSSEGHKNNINKGKSSFVRIRTICYEDRIMELPNIMHLVGTIFGTEEIKKATTKLFYNESLF